MTDYPSLNVLVLTYQRVAILHDTLLALKTHLHYSGKVQYIVCDDGSSDGTQEMVKSEFPSVILIQNQRIGLGAQHNKGLRYAWQTSPYTFALQDDMQMRKPFDISPWVNVLEKYEDIGFVRFWGVLGHHYEGRLESDQELGVGWWRIYWHSPELFIPSDRPHLKHRRFNEHFGMYPERLTSAATEEAWAHWCKDRAGIGGRVMDVIAPHAMDTEHNYEHMGWHCRWRDIGGEANEV